MTALTEAQAAQTELRLSDAWKLYAKNPSSHTFKCDQHLAAAIALLTGVVVAAPSVPSSYTPNKTFAGGTGTNADAFIASLVPGDIPGFSGICLINNKIPVSGRSDAPIIFTSSNWASPATLKFAGSSQWRMDGQGTKSGAGVGWLVYDFLYIDDTQSAQPTTMACGAHDITVRRCDITNHSSHIGVDLIAGTEYGTSRNILIERNRIHDIGPLVYDNRSHGVYNQGSSNVVQDNIIDHCSARGLQDRAGTNARYDHNLVINNRVGIIVGDLSGSHGLRGTKNIFAYSEYAHVRTYSNGGGSDNNLDDNWFWQGTIDSTLENLTVTNRHTGDPLFTNYAAKDYTLQAGSPATGYGPRFSVGPV